MYRQRKRDRRYVQPSVPKQRPRRNNATRRSVGPAIVFPSIAGRVVRADPLALSWATCCFPLREVCRKSFSNASDSHLRFKISDDALFGRATRPPSSARRARPVRPQPTKKGPTVVATVGPQVETPKNNAARRSAGSGKARRSFSRRSESFSAQADPLALVWAGVVSR